MGSNLKHDVYRMHQIFKSTELNFEKVDIRKEYFTSYQESFSKKLTDLLINLKDISVVNKRTDDSMTVWNLIDNFDAIGRSKEIL